MVRIEPLERCAMKLAPSAGAAARLTLAACERSLLHGRSLAAGSRVAIADVHTTGALWTGIGASDKRSVCRDTERTRHVRGNRGDVGHAEQAREQHIRRDDDV
jgi:hypothetical protein